MAESDRRPYAEEIDELIELVRRDPASPAFVDLGEAYLLLGRPREAIEVGGNGLRSAPDSIEGRVMLARAHVALHQWKEAQGELLRVVKHDRNNRLGFSLLGEVLLRRGDYERALPVLQHAQDLNPANPEVLALLKRARAGQPLDPPAPVPTPIAPRRGGGATAPRAAVATAASRSQGVSRPPPAMEPLFDEASEEATHVRGDVPPQPAGYGYPGSGAPAAPASSPSGSPIPGPLTAMAATAGDSARPRPRVLDGNKPVNAAAGSLRRSAAAGENYLNDLLAGGLLEVPGVRVPDVEYDVRPDRRWGRSTTRTFIALFVLLFLGVGAGGTWYYWSEKARAEAIARFRQDAATAKVSGSWDGLEKALTDLRSALEQDQSSTLTMAYVAEVAGLETLLYGAESDRVDAAIKAGSRDIDKPEETGYRELVIAKAAVELSRLASTEPPGTQLAPTRASLDKWLEGHSDDAWARWLQGRAMLAAGERTHAMSALRAAAGGGDPPLPAIVDLANLLVDEGKYDEGKKLYEDVLARSPDHPLALVGLALARAERGVDTAATMDDLNVRLDRKMGPRMAGYRKLALAMAHYQLEDYGKFREALLDATGTTEPRFLARVAMAHVLLGDLAAAATAGSKIAVYSKVKAESDPLVVLLDAALKLASGLPAQALELAQGDNLRAVLLRGQARLDLGQVKEAIADLDPALAAAPENLEVQVLREQARAMVGGKETAVGLENLEKISRKAKSKIAKHALGAALLAIGNYDDGRKRLEQALENVTAEEPNPIAYRTHTALGRLDLAAGNLEGAAAHLDQATKANSGYLPGRALGAKLMLQKGDPDTALDLIGPVVKEVKPLPAGDELTLAEALATHSKRTSQDQADAMAALERASAAGAPTAEVARIAALIDPSGSSRKAPAPKKPAPKRRR